MNMQSLLVALLVLGCSFYAAWALMPAVARRAIAAALLRLPLPAGLAVRLRSAAAASPGCACDGCDHAPANKAAAQVSQVAQVVTFHPRTRR
jgi:hypothetical protein